MQLYFVPEKLPRTMTRTQWKEADRWRRITTKLLATEMEKRRNDFAKMMDDLACFGRASMRIGYEVNPPLLLNPYHE